MCDVLWEVPGCVTKCDRGRVGSKLAKNSVTYFMDGPYCVYVYLEIGLILLYERLQVKWKVLHDASNEFIIRKRILALK